MHSLQWQKIRGRRVQAATATIALFMGATGCTSGSSGGTTGAQQTPSVCATDSRVQAYTVGLEAKAADGAMKIRFMDADPAPPSKGINQWTIQLLDGSDKPIDNATMTIQKPFMPDHGHGSPTTPQSTWMKANGTYDITDVYLFMPGVWQFTFTVTPPGGAADTVQFMFCIDG